MNIPTWPARGPIAPRSTPVQFKFDGAVGSKRHRHTAIEFLLRRRHEDAHAPRERGNDLRTAHDLRKMRRSDFLLAFSNQHQIYGQLPACGVDGIKRGEKRRLRPFLVHGASTDEHSSEPGFSTSAARPGRRRPLCRIHLLDVIREIEAKSAGGARVECGKDTRLAVGGDSCYLTEPGLAKKAHREIAALSYASVLRCYRRLSDPFL